MPPNFLEYITDLDKLVFVTLIWFDALAKKVIKSDPFFSFIWPKKIQVVNNLLRHSNVFLLIGQNIQFQIDLYKVLSKVQLPYYRVFRENKIFRTDLNQFHDCGLI